MRLHRVVSGPLGVFDERVPLINERRICRRLDAFKVVPGRQMADQRFGVKTRELFLADRERDDWNVLRRNLLVAELFVEGHVGVAVNGGYDGCLFARRAELLDGGDAGLPVGETEGRVV